ncbi:hypothetical protein CCR96_11355 [Halochromatium roseum]|nr:hypothetical protein [Halochromatium roseum]
MAMLGVLASGRPYVPLDVNFPESRNRHILEQAGVTATAARRTARVPRPQGSPSQDSRLSGRARRHRGGLSSQSPPMRTCVSSWESQKASPVPAAPNFIRKGAHSVIRSPLIAPLRASNWSPGWAVSTGGAQSALAGSPSPVDTA